MEHVTHDSQQVLVHGFCGVFFLSLWCNEAEIQYILPPDHLTKHLLPQLNHSTAGSSYINTQWSSCIIVIIHMVPYFHDHLILQASLIKILAMNLKKQYQLLGSHCCWSYQWLQLLYTNSWLECFCTCINFLMERMFSFPWWLLRFTSYSDAANHSNEYNYCNVSYTERLRLICPNSSGSWGRQTAEGATVPLCFLPVCEVKHNLHYEDSGTYFCRTQENTKYYVNISVLGRHVAM